MTDKKALIEQLTTTCHGLDPVDPLRLLVDDVIAALREPEQEPVAWISPKGHIHFDPYLDSVPLYRHPPQRTEQEPLTDEQIDRIAHNVEPEDWNCLHYRDSWHDGFKVGFREAETEHKIEGKT